MKFGIGAVFLGSIIASLLGVPKIFIFILLASISLFLPRYNLSILVVASFFNVCNSQIFGISEMPIGFNLLVMSISLSNFFFLFYQRRLGLSPIVVSFSFFLLSALFSAILSDYTSIALVKLFFFVLFIFSVFSSAVIHDDKINIPLMIVHFSFAAASAGLLLSFFPVGYVKNGAFPNSTNDLGLSGVFNHPQWACVALTLLIVMMVYYVSRKRCNTRFGIVAVIMCIIHLILTEARTGIISVAVFLILFNAKRIFNSIKSKSLILSKTVVSILLVTLLSGILILLVFDFSPLFTHVTAILIKNNDANTIASALWDSRGFLIEGSIRNAIDNPCYGIGFEVSNGLYGHREMIATYDPIIGLPLSAPIEKGVFWFALVEEIGVIGGLMFVSFLFSLYRFGIQKGMEINILGWVILVAVLLNCGESIFFSPSGHGGLIWVALGIAFAESNKRNTDRIRNGIQKQIIAVNHG